MVRKYKKGKLMTVAPDKLWLLTVSSIRSVYHRMFWGHYVEKIDSLIELFLSSPTPSLEGQFLNPIETPMRKCAACKTLNTDRLIRTTGKGGKIFHQSSYIALVISTIEGCEMCKYFLRSVLEFDDHQNSKREVYQMIRNCKSKMEIWADHNWDTWKMTQITYYVRLRNPDLDARGEIEVRNYDRK
jgi:hypothetical protein